MEQHNDIEENLNLTAEEWEHAGHLVGKLIKARENLTQLRKQKSELRKLWSTFKYHNHDKDWYIEIIYRLGADIKDASRYEDEMGDRYAEYVIDDVEFQDLTTKEQGMKIYNLLEKTKRDINDEMFIVSSAVMDLWEMGMPLKTLAKAYGASENTTYIFISRQPRFKMRRIDTKNNTLDNTNVDM